MRQDTPHPPNMPVAMQIPDLVVCPDPMQVFMFSAVTWNRHHIHYSKDAAMAEGLPDVVVQRGLIGNFFARLITNWAGDRGELRKLAWKVTRSAVPGRPIVCRGRIRETTDSGEERRLVCEVTASNGDEELIASGEAVVVFATHRTQR